MIYIWLHILWWGLYHELWTLSLGLGEISYIFVFPKLDFLKITYTFAIPLPLSVTVALCSDPVNSVWSNTSSGVAAQNILTRLALASILGPFWVYLLKFTLLTPISAYIFLLSPTRHFVLPLFASRHLPTVLCPHVITTSKQHDNQGREPIRKFDETTTTTTKKNKKYIYTF